MTDKKTIYSGIRDSQSSAHFDHQEMDDSKQRLLDDFDAPLTKSKLRTLWEKVKDFVYPDDDLTTEQVIFYSLVLGVLGCVVALAYSTHCNILFCFYGISYQQQS